MKRVVKGAGLRPTSEATLADGGSARPFDAAILDRSFSLASEAMYALALQRRRLQTKEPEDEVFVLRWWADLQFFIVMLRRLRRAVEIAGHISSHSKRIAAALEEFDTAVPSLQMMRNVGEHIDDYALDSPRRRHPAGRCDLQTGSWDGETFRWLGASLNVDKALDAAERLFGRLKQQS